MRMSIIGCRLRQPTSCPVSLRRSWLSDPVPNRLSSRGAYAAVSSTLKQVVNAPFMSAWEVVDPEVEPERCVPTPREHFREFRVQLRGSVESAVCAADDQDCQPLPDARDAARSGLGGGLME